MSNLINETTLKELVEAGAVREASLIADPQNDGFAVVVKVGMHQKTLRAKRGNIRFFQKLDTAAKYLRGMGLPRFEVDAAQWTRAA